MRVIILFFLICSCRAFTAIRPMTRVMNQIPVHQRIIEGSSSLAVTSDPSILVASNDTTAGPLAPPLIPSSPSSVLDLLLITDTTEQKLMGNVHDTYRQPRIVNIDNDGHLRLPDGRVIFDGFDRTVWKASHPFVDSNDYSSITLSANTLSNNYEIPIGKLGSSTYKVLACSRLNRYWMGPTFDQIPPDTQFLLIDTSSNNNGPYVLVLPLVDGGFRAHLESNSDDGSLHVICSAENGDDAAPVQNMQTLYIGVHDSDPFELLQKGFEHASQALGGSFLPRSQKQIPKSVDEFGWCTWDAFYSKVDPDGIIEGIKSLRDAGVPPKTLILDDGWQDVSPEVAPLQKDEQELSSISSSMMNAFSQVGQRVYNVVFGLFVSLVVAFYENFVRRAPHGSIGNVIWKSLSHTVLKGGLWSFFNSETDFARQLNDFSPNYKFNKKKATSSDTKNNGKGVNNLRDLVSKLKDELDVHRVYCWHAIHGYWRGVSSELGERMGFNVAQINPKPSKHMLKVEPVLEWDPVSLYGVGLLTTQEDLHKFYEHLHTPLVEAGVDGVKVDVQSGVSAIGANEGPDSPHLAKFYNEAMEKSVSQRFQSEDGAVDCINCMCHSTENLYRYKATAVARASEDFFPDRKDSQTVHIVNVAYNSLFLGEICVPDWDMFHSKHDYAPLHAAARSIGGCPIYVSDKPGQHNPALLKKLVLPDGSILRGRLPGRPTRDCLFQDVGTDGVSALKIWNENTYGGVVGAFNVQGVAWNYETHENEVLDENPATVSASVKPSDVEGLKRGVRPGPFCAWSHQKEELTLLATSTSEIETNLDHLSWDIFTIVPVQKLGEVSWAPIGLADMMNSGGALVHVDELEECTAMTMPSDDKRLSSTTLAGLTTKGPGRFVAYCQPAPTRILVDGNPVQNIDFDYDSHTGKLTFDLPAYAHSPPSSSAPHDDDAHHRLTVVWDEEQD